MAEGVAHRFCCDVCDRTGGGIDFADMCSGVETCGHFYL